MPKAKTGFKKSHGGCNRCKLRKVKCNEAKPQCNNCLRHGIPCEYPPSRSAAHPPLHSRPVGHGAPLMAANDEDNSPFGSIQRRHLELQLMHYFVTVVGLTFPSSSLQLAKGLWTVDAVRLAFQHDFLLNAIFAIAALHLVRGLPDSFRFTNTVQQQSASITKPGIDLGSTEISLVKVHSFYLDLAVKQQREAVALIRPENANALVFASVLISYQGLKLPPIQPDLIHQPYHPPVQWLRMVRGIKDISAVAGHIGYPEPVIPHMLRVSGEPDLNNKSAFFNSANQERFQYLLDLKDLDGEENTKVTEAYEKAVSYIGRMANDIESERLPRVIFRLVLGFAVLIPSTFIDCVDAGRPKALIILAHYFAMAKAVDDHWIFAGLADREVEGIRGLLPQKWQHYLAWPLRIMRSPTHTLKNI